MLMLPLIAWASPALAETVPPAPAVVPAATPDDPPGMAVEVTWPELVRLVDRHPRLAAGKSRIDAARGGVDAAGAVPNPVLEGSVGRGLDRAGGASRVEWGLSLTIPLGWIAQRGSRIGAAEAVVEVALAERLAIRRDVLLQLQTLFWTLVHERARVASLEALEAETSELARAVSRRVERGDVRPVEAIRAEVELEKVAGELEVARTVLSAGQAGLAIWLGLPADRTPVAVADLGALPAVMDRDAALARARATHPALALARARTRTLDAEAGAERMTRVPPFSVSGFATSELDRRAFGAGLSVDLPLWDWNSGRIARAEAELSAGRAQAEATGLEVEASVVDSHAACQASVLSAARFRDSLLPRSETAAVTMEKMYQHGEASLLEVIDARRTLLDSRRLYLDALVRAQIDCGRLGVLVGEESR